MPGVVGLEASKMGALLSGAPLRGASRIPRRGPSRISSLLPPHRRTHLLLLPALLASFRDQLLGALLQVALRARNPTCSRGAKGYSFETMASPAARSSAKAASACSSPASPHPSPRPPAAATLSPRRTASAPARPAAAPPPRARRAASPSRSARWGPTTAASLRARPARMPSETRCASSRTARCWA